MDIRTTLNGESSLIIAIKNGYQNLIEYMFGGIWTANGMNSALVFGNIVRSPYGNSGATILESLIQFKLFSVLNYLIGQNNKSQQSFLSQQDILSINQAMNGGMNMNGMNGMNVNGMNSMNNQQIHIVNNGPIMMNNMGQSMNMNMNQMNNNNNFNQMNNIQMNGMGMNSMNNINMNNNMQSMNVMQINQPTMNNMNNMNQMNMNNINNMNMNSMNMNNGKFMM